MPNLRTSSVLSVGIKDNYEELPENVFHKRSHTLEHMN